jgi:plastocyanin
MIKRFMNGRRGAVRIAACAAIAATLYALPAEAARHIIVIDNMRFVPSSVVVQRGDEVVWLNRDLVAHTATAVGVFDSPVIEPGRSWSYRAGVPGHYRYGCSLHPSMKATLIVEKDRVRPGSR